jgi:hypothetical protein
MILSDDEVAILRAVANCGQACQDGFTKCDRVLRTALQSSGAVVESAENALCNSGYEDRRVGELYDALRSLATRGLVQSRGDFRLPAGPRYTECGMTSLGQTTLTGLRRS